MIELKSKTSADFAFFFLKVKENKISLANPKERFLRSLPFFIRDARTSPNSCVKRDQDSNPPSSFLLSIFNKLLNFRTHDQERTLSF